MVLRQTYSDWSHGGQFLHVVFAFESFLYQLLHREAIVNIAFFNVFEPFWQSVNPVLAAARAILIKHAQAWVSSSSGTNGGVAQPHIHVIDGAAPFWPISANRELAKLLSIERPALVISEYAWPNTVASKFLQQQATPDYVAVYNDIAVVFLHSIHLRHIDVVLLQQMASSGAGFKGFFCQVPSPKNLAIIDKVILANAAASSSKVQAAAATAATAATTSPVLSKWNDFGGDSLKVQLSLNALAAAVASLKDTTHVQLLSDVWTLALVLSQHLPLHQRAFLLPDDWVTLETSVPALQGLAEVLKTAAQAVTGLLAQAPASLAVDISDLWDGRFLSALTLIATSSPAELTLSGELAASLARIRTAAGKSLPSTVSAAWSTSTASITSAVAAPETQVNAAKAALAYIVDQSKLLAAEHSTNDHLLPRAGSYLPSILDETFLSKLQPFENSGNSSDSLFAERANWSLGRNISIEDDVFTKETPVAAAVSKLKELKYRQRDAVAMVYLRESTLAGLPVRETNILELENSADLDKRRQTARQRIHIAQAAEGIFVCLFFVFFFKKKVK